MRGLFSPQGTGTAEKQVTLPVAKHGERDADIVMHRVSNLELAHELAYHAPNA